MRWLLDQGLRRSAAVLLNEAAQDAVHVGDIGMAGAADSLILHRAASEKRVIVLGRRFPFPAGSRLRIPSISDSHPRGGSERAGTCSFDPSHRQPV